MDHSLKVSVVLRSLQKMVLVCKEPAVSAIDGSDGACSRATGMAMARQPFHSFSFCRLLSAVQSPASSIPSLPWNSPCAVIGVIAVLPSWAHGLETWKQGSTGISSALLYCPKTAYGFDFHTGCKIQNLQEILKFAVQHIKDTPHIQIHNFKYHGVIE